MGEIMDYSGAAKLLVYAEDGADMKAAEAAAASLGVALCTDRGQADSADLKLCFTAEGAMLIGGSQTLRGDFSHMLPRLRAGNLSGELLVKAAKIKGSANPFAIDCTAGMGEDSLLLAAAGFSVRMYEYNAVIAALLGDAMRRAALDPKLSEIISRMQLCAEDSIPALAALTEAPDVILLDPMFPPRQKSALVKKKFQLLHQLERPCEDEASLLYAAIDARPRKIVIKRPLKGAYLGGIKPSCSFTGKAIRYDVLLPSGLSR